MTDTGDIRTAISAIQSQLTIISSKCDEIDNTGTPTNPGNPVIHLGATVDGVSAIPALYTIIDKTITLTPGAVVTALGYSCARTHAMTPKIFKHNGTSAAFDVAYSGSQVTHTGGGMQHFPITSFTVPNDGSTYRVGFAVQYADGSDSYSYSGAGRWQKAGNITANAQTFTYASDGSCAMAWTEGGTPAVVPTGRNCLAGTVPADVNLYPNEASYSPWLNKRSAYLTNMSSKPDGTIMFLGHSMVENGDWSQVSQYCANYGIAGESMRQFQYRLKTDYHPTATNLIHRAGALVVFTGINDGLDTRNGTPAQAAALVNNLFANLAAWFTGKIVIIKVGKLDPSLYTSAPAGINTDFVDVVNANIQTLFGSRTDCKIVDINPDVAPMGVLLSQHTPDGLHWAQSVYNTYVNPKVKQSLKDLNVI